MNNMSTRRDWLKTTATMAGGLAWTGSAARTIAAGTTRPACARPLVIKKALKYAMVEGELSVLDKFKLVQELGYDGIEINVSDIDRKKVVEARDKTGLPIHGVVAMDTWHYPLSAHDADVRARGVEVIKTAIEDARLYGGDSVLVVPAVVNKETAYDDAYRRSQAAIRKVLPFAEKHKIRILFENVWNNFLLSPLEAARYIDEFESPVVGAYFDVGNIILYGWPEQWIRILGKRIVKLDIKEYSRSKCDNEGRWAGFKVELGEGDDDWPAVMRALQEIRFSGWATAEVRGGDRERLADVRARMERILKY